MIRFRRVLMLDFYDGPLEGVAEVDDSEELLAFRYVWADKGFCFRVFLASRVTLSHPIEQLLSLGYKPRTYGGVPASEGSELMYGLAPNLAQLTEGLDIESAAYLFATNSPTDGIELIPLDDAMRNFAKEILDSEEWNRKLDIWEPVLRGRATLIGEPYRPM